MFTWDEKKRKLNLAKHGIDFRDAAKVFDGPLVTVEDTREDYGEARYVALGLLEGIVVSMVYTERGSAIRLISIRKALKHETRFSVALSLCGKSKILEIPISAASYGAFRNFILRNGFCRTQLAAS